MNLTAEIFKGMNTPDGKPSEETLERWAALTEDIKMDEKTRCCKPNYEDMYNELCEKYHKLKAENDELRANLREATTQNENLRARLDMVYLIFGRNC